MFSPLSRHGWDVLIAARPVLMLLKWLEEKKEWLEGEGGRTGDDGSITSGISYLLCLCTKTRYIKHLYIYCELWFRRIYSSNSINCFPFTHSIRTFSSSFFSNQFNQFSVIRLHADQVQDPPPEPPSIPRHTMPAHGLTL